MPLSEPALEGQHGARIHRHSQDSGRAAQGDSHMRAGTGSRQGLLRMALAEQVSGRELAVIEPEVDKAAAAVAAAGEAADGVAVAAAAGGGGDGGAVVAAVVAAVAFGAPKS